MPPAPAPHNITSPPRCAPQSWPTVLFLFWGRGHALQAQQRAEGVVPAGRGRGHCQTLAIEIEIDPLDLVSNIKTPWATGDLQVEAANLTKGSGRCCGWHPEIMEGSAKYGQPADVYSFAIVLWEILSRSLPWEDITTTGIRFRTELRETVASGGRPLIPVHCPTDYRRLIEQCWATNPEARHTLTRA